MGTPYDVERSIKLISHEIADIVGSFVEIEAEYRLAEQPEKSAVLTGTRADIQHRLEFAVMPGNQLHEAVEPPGDVEVMNFSFHRRDFQRCCRFHSHVPPSRARHAANR